MNNYYSLESDNKYMSCSQLDKFEQCEAAYLAYLKGDNPHEGSTAMLVGNYVHSWAEGTLEQFKESHAEILTQKGTLKSEFKLAETMIQTINKDEFCMYMLQGESEVAFFGELFGLPWKIRLDKWNVEKYRIVDLKTTKNIWEKEWVNGERVTFIEKYKYPRRAAVYAEIVRQNLNRENMPSFFIVAVSKENIPDKAIIDLTDVERWERELSDIRSRIERIKLVRMGKIEPLRCDKCDYCKKTKMIEKIINYGEM